MSLEVIKRLNVDFHDTKYISINAKQHDRHSRFILITCYDNGVIFPISSINNYAFIRYRKSDDLGVFNSCEITEDGNILVELSEQMLASSGRCYADLVIIHTTGSIDIDKNTGELILSNDFSILSTMHFCVNVIETSFNNVEIESSYEYNALNDLLNKATSDYTDIINACRISEENAKASETNAKASENLAFTHAHRAGTYASNAETSEANAKASELKASNSESNAKESENIAVTKASEAHQSAIESAENATTSTNMVAKSLDYSILSKSYAVGGTYSRTNENKDNSKYYYTQAKAIKDSIDGSFLPMGTIKYSELQSVTKATSYVYHVSDEFVTDDTFKCGTGVTYPAGTNVYYTVDGYWDCFIGQVITIDAFEKLNQTIAELQERIKVLEDQSVLEIVE